MAAGQAVRRRRLDVTFLQFDLGTQVLQRLEVQIDRPRADGTTARQRHPRPPGAGQQRPHDDDRGPHPANKVVGRFRRSDLAGVQADDRLVAVIPLLPRHLGAQFAQQAAHGGKVCQVRHVGQFQRIFGEKRASHQRQRRVLRPADRDGAV